MSVPEDYKIFADRDSHSIVTPDFERLSGTYASFQQAVDAAWKHYTEEGREKYRERTHLKEKYARLRDSVREWSQWYMAYDKILLCICTTPTLDKAKEAVRSLPVRKRQIVRAAIYTNFLEGGKQTQDADAE